MWGSQAFYFAANDYEIGRSKSEVGGAGLNRTGEERWKDDAVSLEGEKRRDHAIIHGMI